MFDVTPVTSPKQFDCGPTCLKMLLGYYGIDVPLETLAEECNVTTAGCTGADLLRAGRLHGLDMQSWSIDADELVRQDRPAIVNWKYNHWVVFAGRDEDGRVWVANPDRGRFRMSEGTFRSFFTGLDGHPGQGVAITNGEPRDLDTRPVASDNHARGDLFAEGGTMYRALRVIVRGERVIEGYNAAATTVADEINAINAESEE